MIDPISAWNDTIYPSCEYLFKLFGEIADYNDLTKLDAFPVAKAQWMDISYERMTEIYTTITGKELVSHANNKFLKCAVAYGNYVKPEWYIGSDPNKLLLTILPCDLDILCKRIRMSPWELHMLGQFTELLGLKDPDIMKEYRAHIYTSQNLKSMKVLHQAMQMAAK